VQSVDLHLQARVDLLFNSVEVELLVYTVRADYFNNEWAASTQHPYIDVLPSSRRELIAVGPVAAAHNLAYLLLDG